MSLACSIRPLGLRSSSSRPSARPFTSRPVRAMACQQQQESVASPSEQPITSTSESATLLWVKAAVGAQSQNAASLALPLLVLGGLALAAEPALAQPSHQFDLAEGQEFWGNVARYGRYFVTVMLGTGYVMLRPLAGMFKKPLTAMLGIALLVGGAVVTKYTLEAMLGLSEPLDYVPYQLGY